MSLTRRTSRVAALSMALAAWAGIAAAQETPGQPLPDLLRGPVDPYVPGTERAVFLKVAGVDTELDEPEFKTASEAGGPFVRGFDRWAAMRRYDRNGDGKLDWFEADAYRKALREAVIAKYDTNRNKRLEGAERDAANRDLAAGQPPNIAIAAAPSPPAPAGEPGRPRQPFNFNFAGDPNAQFNPKFDEQGRLAGLPPQLLQEIDTDGDGLVSQDERLDAAGRVYGMARDGLLREYDKDGDGILSADERQAMITPLQFLLDIHDLYKVDYDADGDGQLSRQEQAAIDEDLQAYLKLAEKNQLKVMDSNGNGEVDPEEITAMQTKVQFAMMQLAPKAISWVDQDGDGQLTPEEGLATFNRFRGTFNERIADLRHGADSDGDGRLNAQERASLMQKMIDDDTARIMRYSKSGDGQLTANDLARLYEDLAEEWGVKPRTTQ